MARDPGWGASEATMSGWTTVWVLFAAVAIGALTWFTTPKGPNQVYVPHSHSLIRSSVVLTLACCYLMWFCVYMAQLHPLIRTCLAHRRTQALGRALLRLVSGQRRGGRATGRAHGVARPAPQAAASTGRSPARAARHKPTRPHACSLRIHPLSLAVLYESWFFRTDLPSRGQVMCLVASLVDIAVVRQFVNRIPGSAAATHWIWAGSTFLHRAITCCTSTPSG